MAEYPDFLLEGVLWLVADVQQVEMIHNIYSLL